MPNGNYRCCCCKEVLESTKFYKSYSNFYSDGHLPICKECFARYFAQYAIEYHSNKMAMQRMCMAFDVFYDENLLEKSDSNNSSVIGNYFKKLNMNQCKGKTFENSIKSGFTLSGERKPVNIEKVTVAEEDDDAKIPQRYIDKWGYGLSKNDYETLDAHYKCLKNANPNCDSNQEIFIIDLCYIKMQQMKAVRENSVDNYNKLTESYRKSFTQAGLKTVRDSSEIDEFTVGVGIETIEKYTPAEFYKDKTLFKDFDGIGDYFKRAVLRPLRNAFLGTNERDEEYCIKSDGDDDENGE